MPSSASTPPAVSGAAGCGAQPSRANVGIAVAQVCYPGGLQPALASRRLHASRWPARCRAPSPPALRCSLAACCTRTTSAPDRQQRQGWHSMAQAEAAKALAGLLSKVARYSVILGIGGSALQTSLYTGAACGEGRARPAPRGPARACRPPIQGTRSAWEPGRAVGVGDGRWGPHRRCRRCCHRRQPGTLAPLLPCCSRWRRAGSHV